MVQDRTAEAPAAWRPINLNDHVRVKLTKRGMVAFMERRLELNRSLRPGAQPFPLQPDLDEEGFYRTQLWHLMQVFGHLCMLGPEPPFHTEMETKRG